MVPNCMCLPPCTRKQISPRHPEPPRPCCPFLWRRECGQCHARLLRTLLLHGPRSALFPWPPRCSQVLCSSARLVVTWGLCHLSLTSHVLSHGIYCRTLNEGLQVTLEVSVNVKTSHSEQDALKQLPVQKCPF